MIMLHSQGILHWLFVTTIDALLIGKIMRITAFMVIS